MSHIFIVVSDGWKKPLNHSRGLRTGICSEKGWWLSWVPVLTSASKLSKGADRVLATLHFALYRCMTQFSLWALTQTSDSSSDCHNGRVMLSPGSGLDVMSRTDPEGSGKGEVPRVHWAQVTISCSEGWWRLGTVALFSMRRQCLIATRHYPREPTDSVPKTTSVRGTGSVIWWGLQIARGDIFLSFSWQLSKMVILKIRNISTSI